MTLSNPFDFAPPIPSGGAGEPTTRTLRVPFASSMQEQELLQDLVAHMVLLTREIAELKETLTARIARLDGLLHTVLARLPEPD